MHDITFSNEIIRVINDRAKNLDAGSRIKCVNVRLSPLSHVAPGTLKAAFSQMAGQSNLGDILLNVRPCEIELRCRSCGTKFSAESPKSLACPQCKNSDFDIGQGREFFVESIEIEQE